MTKARDIASAIPAPSTVSSAELGFLDGVTSAIQTQVDAKTAKATLTTTGDIYYASGASTPARLGIGSSAQVLTVASGIPSWATPTAAGANYTLLNSGGTALTAASTITVSGISNVNKIMVIISGASGSALDYYGIRFNTNTTGVYLRYGGGITGDAAYASNVFYENNNTGTSFYFGAQANTGTGTVSGGITLDGCNSSGVKTATVLQGALFASSNRQELSFYHGIFNSSAVITSVSIVNSAGNNFDAGTIFVYTSA